MVRKKEEKEVEVVTLSTGETLNKWCLSQFDNLTLNTEVIWDILDVSTNLTRLNLTKNEDGLLTDVSLVLPKITEDLVLFALKNFMKFQGIREANEFSAETILEMRRHELQKHMEELNK